MGKIKYITATPVKQQIIKTLKFKVGGKNTHSSITKVDFDNHYWVTEGGHCVDFRKGAILA